jgi:hypothetical protein
MWVTPPCTSPNRGGRSRTARARRERGDVDVEGRLGAGDVVVGGRRRDRFEADAAPAVDTYARCLGAEGVVLASVDPHSGVPRLLHGVEGDRPFAHLVEARKNHVVATPKNTVLFPLSRGTFKVSFDLFSRGLGRARRPRLTGGGASHGRGLRGVVVACALGVISEGAPAATDDARRRTRAEQACHARLVR